MPQMKAVQVSSAGKEFELVQRDIPQPGPGMVQIKIDKSARKHFEGSHDGSRPANLLLSLLFQTAR